MNEAMDTPRTELGLAKKLCDAAFRNDFAGMRDALDAGASPDRSDLHGYTPLRYAARSGHAEAIHLLIERGADVRGGLRMREDATYLHEAALSGSADAVRALVDAGSSVHDTRHYNWTPLMCACSTLTRKESTAVVAELLERGSDVHARDTFKNTPLHIAAAGGFAEIVALLLAHGADPNVTDNAGDTPLHQVLRLPAQRAAPGESIVTSLLKAGADVNADSGRQQITPLHFAAAHASETVVTLLIQSGANINAADTSGRTPLGEAVGSPENFAVLLAAGADVSPLTQGSEKPVLITAAEKGNTAAIKALLAVGTDPNLLYRGKSALHSAVAKSHGDVVAALLAAGADHLLPDKDGVTALDLARKRRRKAVLPLMEAAEAARQAAAISAAPPAKSTVPPEAPPEQV